MTAHFSMETLRHLDKAFQAKESETQPRITDSAKSSTIIERERKKIFHDINSL